MNTMFRKLLLALTLLVSLPAFAAQTVILSAGQSAATSSDVTCTGSCSLVVYSPNGPMPDGVVLNVYQVANSIEQVVGTLSRADPVFKIQVPGTFRVKRPDVSATGLNLGVTSDIASVNSATVAPTGQTNMAGALSVAIASDQTAVPENQTQIAGTAITAGNGTTTAGTQRVTIASDSTGQIALAAGAATIGALTANQSVNNAQISGVTMSAGNGVSGTGVQRITLASDSTGQVALAAGAAKVGVVTTDQTTHGTSDLIAADLTKVAGTAISTGTGAQGTGAPRVTVATDSATVAGSASLPTGTNTVGSVKLTDGTNVATVKAASTAPLATDTSAVMTESPNSPLVPAQSSTTSGQLGPLMQGAVLTAAPTYTTAQTNPLTLTVGGALRNDIASISGTAVSVGTGANGNGVIRVAPVGVSTLTTAVPAAAFYIGGIATTASPTNATAGNLTGMEVDKAGRVVTTAVNVRELTACQHTALASASETTAVTAGAAGVFNDITSIEIDSAGAAAATITLRDGTAGATKHIYNYPVGSVAQAGFVRNYSPPITQAAAAANWTVQNSVATATDITICYAQNK